MKLAAKSQPAQWQPWPTDALHNLTALAQASVGFDSTRGDVLTVQDLAFDGNRPTPPPPIAGRVLGEIEDSPELVKYAALLAGLLLVLALGVRPALAQARTAIHDKGKSGKKGAGKGVQELTEPGAQHVFAPPEPPAPDPARIRAQEIFEQVTTHLKHEPTQSSRLLQSWIHSD